MSHSAWSTPDSALLSTGPPRQYDERCTMRVMFLDVGRVPADQHRTHVRVDGATTARNRCVNVAQPNPYRPGSEVSDTHTTTGSPSGAVTDGNGHR